MECWSKSLCVFYIMRLLYKLYGPILEVEAELELPGNFEHISLQSRPLLVTGKTSTLRRALTVLIAKLMDVFAGLAFTIFCCLLVDLLLTQGEKMKFLWEVSTSYRGNGDM